MRLEAQRACLAWVHSWPAKSQPIPATKLEIAPFFERIGPMGVAVLAQTRLQILMPFREVLSGGDQVSWPAYTTPCGSTDGAWDQSGLLRRHKKGCVNERIGALLAIARVLRGRP